MKICVIAGLYRLSGVPLAQLKLARALFNDGHDVELIYIGNEPGYAVPNSENFKIINLKKKRVITSFFNLLNIVKKKNFDLIFSAGDHLNVLVLFAAILTRSNVKISCSSRVTPFDTYSNYVFSKRWILKQLMKFVMYRADVLTCVSNEMIDQYKKVFNGIKQTCIYNIVHDRYSINLMNEAVDEEWLINKTKPVIVAAGMLEPWKGFDDLILAFKKLIQKVSVRLLILGDGSQKKKLEELIKKNNLADHVKLKGYVTNPLKFFSKADVFALSSHVEGMPNVLIEAMMAGCTPVATNCKTGPNEVLQNGKYGYLVPVQDINSLSEGLLMALNKPINKNILSEAILSFSEKKVIEAHFKSLKIKTYNDN